MISILTIANDEDMYKRFMSLLSNQKDIEYEMLCVDNYDNHIVSARQAFMEKVEEAKGDIILFIHPDIVFLNDNVLHDFIESFCSINNVGVVGIAGSPTEVVNNNRIILSNILHGSDRHRAGVEIDSPKEVQTVDECMFAIKTNILKKIGFLNYEGYHLYAVELCLSCLLNGLDNYVVPVDVWHISDGRSLNPQYVKTLRRMARDFSESFEYINTTVRRWRLRGFKAWLYMLYYLNKQRLKKLLGI